MQIQRQEDQWPKRVAEVRRSLFHAERDHWGLWPHTNEPVSRPASVQELPT